ncbi:MAG: hypothetical protein GU344_00175 [Thermocrinis sp.]|jgi:hypothetical protein|nr:hypothetical protein [Thermocrinis sp.]
MIVRLWKGRKGKKKGWIELRFRVKKEKQMHTLLSKYVGSFIEFESIEEALLANFVLDRLPSRWRREVNKFIQSYISLYRYKKR